MVESKVQVLYIMGMGRSGSTALDTVLGNHPEIESVGELSNLPRSMWINNEYCACGQHSRSCPFWSHVRQAWSEHVNAENIEDYRAYQSSFMWFRHVPRLLLERHRPSAQFQLFSEWTWALFDAIRKVSGKSIIVDSSKSPARALALSMIPNLDVQLLHLVRDVRGVTWSMGKTIQADKRRGVERNLFGRSVTQMARSWAVANIESDWVRRQLAPSQSIRIRYEDFVSVPGETLARIGALIQHDFSDLADAIDNGSSLQIGHTIAGGRMRMKGSMQLRLDGEWMQQMPLWNQWQCRLLVGWLMHHYGYQWQYN